MAASKMSSRRRYSFLLFPLLAISAVFFSATLAVAAEAAHADDAPSANDSSSSDSDAPPAIVASVPIKTSDAEGAHTTTAYVNEGEDAAIGAFRYFEEHGNFRNIEVRAVVDVARDLASALPETYAPLQEFTHCQGGKKSRVCSAGKLWKRAEEMRAAGIHDAAGADLIRTLLKTGIERDFAEKVERNLELAFYNMKKLREREAREAEEEAKREVRRLKEEEAAAEAQERKKEYDAHWASFSEKLRASLAESTKEEAAVGADGNIIDANPGTTNALMEFVRDDVADEEKWRETVRLIKKISDKTIDVLLVEARCHEQLGNHKVALSVAGRLVQKAANHEPWINGSPRMMAVTIGANAAMQLGLSENALSFFQTVLKFDPEQPQARKQYRGLKKVVKLLGKAEDQIQKGYNKAASDIVDDCLSAMRGLDVDSPLFRSKIQLKQCTILSGMGKHEEALNHCDAAVSVRLESDTVSPASRKEAHLVRAEALLLDMDYDEAVQDLRAAHELVPDKGDDDSTDETMVEKRELQHKLQSTMQQQDLWNGGKMDQRYNEHTGFPEGRPPERDHAKILQLPIDLENREKEVKCAWLRKQFKTLVRKFHPDKYKGDKKRGSRKFKEVTDSKGHMSAAWGCKS